MIAIDTSTLMAIVLNEPGERLHYMLEIKDHLLISAGTMADALIVAARRMSGRKWRG